MQRSNINYLILASAFLLMLVTPARLADLQCYVCDDCENVENSQLMDCNEGFFNKPTGTTEASTGTTTADSTTEDTTTSAIAETTATAETETTTVTEPTTTQNNEPPTAPTVAPPETTTSMPTPKTENPPTVDTIDTSNVAIAVSNDTKIDNSGKTSTENPPPNSPAARRRRDVNSITYHCFTVQVKINNTISTNRGCSRVAADQDVCKQLQIEDTNVSKCDPCSMNACNSAKSLLQSSVLGTLLIAIIAAMLQHN